jgi:sn1-specific diacylglycerol lipase
LNQLNLLWSSHYPAESTPGSDFLQQLRRFEAMQQNRRSICGISREISLYPPGNIIHLVKTGQSRSCTHNLSNWITCGASSCVAEYTPIGEENDNFNKIEISPTLWTDHFPNRVCNALEKIAENFGTSMALDNESNANYFKPYERQH